MSKLNKDYLLKTISEAFQSDVMLMNLDDEAEEFQDCFCMSISLCGLLTSTGKLDIHGFIYIYDDGYVITTHLGNLAAKSAIPELLKFVEGLNNRLGYGDVNVDFESGELYFRTYERFWEEHSFASNNLREAIETHIEASKCYKEPLYLLIKGASSADKQLSKLV